MLSAAYALEVKKREERELREASREALALRRRDAPMTLREICELYFRENPNHVSSETTTRDRIHAANVCRLLDDALPPDRVGEAAMVRYRNVREKEGAAPRTIEGEMSFAFRMLQFGFAWKDETGMKGVALLKLPPVLADSTPAGVALTVGEVGAVLEVARERDREIVIVGLTTMLRLTPLAALERSWTDLGRRRWLSVPADMMKKGHAKFRLPLEVPLSSWAAETLRRSDGATALYWPSSATGAALSKPAMWRLCDRLAHAAKLRSAFSPHDLRTTGATILNDAGVDEMTIGILMGHRTSFDASRGTFHARSGSVTRGYTKLFESSLREAVGVFDDVKRKLGLKNVGTSRA